MEVGSLLFLGIIVFELIVMQLLVQLNVFLPQQSDFFVELNDLLVQGQGGIAWLLNCISVLHHASNLLNRVDAANEQLTLQQRFIFQQFLVLITHP